MFNPHTHQQQQHQQQQFHQHLRQLQQLFHQQPPPPPPPPPPPQSAPARHVAHHRHQAPRPISVPPHTTPTPPRMVNLCQATQTSIISPNPMLQGALMMQQMQGNMRGFGMGGQQFRQFFAATNRSLLGPVPIGMAMKSPLMGFPPPARPFHPHPRFYNNASLTTSAAATSTATTSSVTATSTDAVVPQSDKKSDSEVMADGPTADIPAASKASTTETDGVVEWVDGSAQSFEEQLEEPAVKRQRMEGSEEPKEDAVVNTANSDGEDLVSECKIEGTQLDDCLLEDRGLTPGSEPVEGMEECHASIVGDDEPSDKPEAEGGGAEGVNKFYCYLCTITCHSQENFRSHMNSVSHQQRMMEIQHMSNACLVTLLPRLHETLQGTSKDGEKKADMQGWCATCCVHYSSSFSDHRRTEEHKIASRAAVSSCGICKKNFRSSKLFVAHLQSQEHRQRLEKESSVTSSKLLDKDGFDLEEEKDEERDLDEEYCPETQDGYNSSREVTLKDMASDAHYDPDTIYDSSFFVPVAGFICRLCNKFYHFDSSALHTHCKSLKHFDNLKRHKESLGKNTNSDKNSTENQRQDSAEEPGTCQASKAPAKVPAVITDLPASTDNTKREEDNENALPKPNTRRRSGRAASRR
ncbi:cdkn1a interacting zinc finger protein 1a isoform X2 [Syngnathoides biaculeatus]|uniref:cdkn1a interacting zinc finger protein 1a isoform X2 n=1 Tax=Syngnathoides biaculeatus TaxID=300417 RepID=UPI002ADD368D|nr:cdkn1a interacting zinc finger protein 1a isoform X2 [Syngnathoides biaculeatus]